jgi:hypothetical protein
MTPDFILLHWILMACGFEFLFHVLISSYMNCISGSCCRAFSAKYAEVTATVWTSVSLPGKFHVNNPLPPSFSLLFFFNDRSRP